MSQDSGLNVMTETLDGRNAMLQLLQTLLGYRHTSLAPILQTTALLPRIRKREEQWPLKIQYLSPEHGRWPLCPDKCYVNKLQYPIEDVTF